MKIREDFLLRSAAGSAVVVAVGKNVETFLSMLKLNPSAEMLFKRMEQGATRDELARALISEYVVDEVTARRDANAFADKLMELGVAQET